MRKAHKYCISEETIMKKKKALVAILFFTLVLNLVGCSDSNGYTPRNTEDSTFITVESSDYYSIVYHKDTKVMYIINKIISRFAYIPNHIFYSYAI